MCCLKINKNKILFISNDATAWTCNPKYLSLYLNDTRDYDIVWAFNANIINKEQLPKGMRTVRFMSLAYFYNLYTAAMVISNHRMNFDKRNGQKYIQTWHSSMRLKKIEGDAIESLNKEYIEMAKVDSSNIDMIVSGCDFSTRFFKNSFWYNGQVAKTGTPRIDYIMDEHPEICDKARKKLSINGSFVLYAPTFRKNKPVDFYNIDADKIVSALQSKSWKVVSKLHPNLINMMEDLKVSDSLINGTIYDDTQELIIASDMVITDYSSLMFDCVFIHKPCILYMPDYDEYIKKERGLYFDISELPFPKAFSADELTECLKSFDKAKYDVDIDIFLAQIGSYEDGHACERISKIIDDMLKG